MTLQPPISHLDPYTLPSSEQFMEERRALLNDTQSKISSQEKLLKAEILELRHQRTTLEDRLSQLGDDFQAMQAKATNLSILCRQVEQGRDEAVEGQNRLRGEIRLMKESFSQTFRQDTVTPAFHTVPITLIIARSTPSNPL